MLFFDPFRLTSAHLARPAVFAPTADVTASDSDLVLTMDVPGFAEEDLNIELYDGYLIVSGERAVPQAPEGTTFVHTERPYGRFERRIKVPEGVDPEAITANLADGVLSVIVPKPERLRPRKLEITSGGAGQRELEASTA